MPERGFFIEDDQRGPEYPDLLWETPKRTRGTPQAKRDHRGSDKSEVTYRLRTRTQQPNFSTASGIVAGSILSVLYVCQLAATATLAPLRWEGMR